MPSTYDVGLGDTASRDAFGRWRPIAGTTDADVEGSITWRELV